MTEIKQQMEELFTYSTTDSHSRGLRYILPKVYLRVVPNATTTYIDCY